MLVLKHPGSGGSWVSYCGRYKTQVTIHRSQSVPSMFLLSMLEYSRRPLQCRHLNHECKGFICNFFSLISLLFSELANQSCELKQQPRHFFAFLPRYFQSDAVISLNGRGIFPNFGLFFVSHSRPTSYNS